MELTEVQKHINHMLAEVAPQAYLVEALLRPGRSPVLEVVVDTDQGIALGECARINRALREQLDLQVPALANYEIAVGSPGVGQPLKVARQYARNLGKTLALRLTNGQALEGKLEAYAEGTLTLSQSRKNPETRKTETIHTQHSLSEVKEARVRVII